MSWQTEYPRRVPARRPEGHTPRAPRWTLSFDEPTSLLTSDYLAIQVDSMEAAGVEEFLAAARASWGQDHAPESYELLAFVDAQGALNLVSLGYWRDATEHARWCLTADLPRWFAGLEPRTLSFGMWHEVIQVPMDRFETIYSDPARPFGMAGCPGTERVPMTTNGYFGAARDRFPVSAIDRLEAPTPHRRREPLAPSRGRRLRAESGHNAIAIRSGQYWEESEGDQLVDYEENLQSKLMTGMRFLQEHADQQGVMSLRIMTSLDVETLRPRRETSVLGHFAEMELLERWAEGHETHAAIYEHAIEKKREYGDERSVVTWHEVFAMVASTAYEYVNCHEETGILPYAVSVSSVEP
ncbi:phenylacetaldoxime dehydratase [Aeromicrobium sp. PE09-221]|uniref:phenylacetaldoxime dehydratase family protein n=1 Tax=Aeromicrobium sp. PE09-221 TaxID=1898043 RepID=UPI000B3E998C|nr:phenylacetaldoxime dehydratase family protein [Aeromicrobium sp. PE09-221]OUZ11935.1 phenylacetaldoxime dehydratase [Aeromicrobium sp. PE09-221]